jgi:hypothetical protein
MVNFVPVEKTMCTLTYLPFENESFLLTFNRDESPHRPSAIPPSVFSIQNKLILYPLDPMGGGTWIASANSGLTACIMNGAFTIHEREENYRKSRGLILLELFSCPDVYSFIRSVDLIGIEPFTMLIITNSSPIAILELRWNGETKHIRFRQPSDPFMLSSAAVYKPEIFESRNVLFHDFLKNNPKLNEQQILDFHHLKKRNDTEDGFIIDIPETVKTVSITQLKKNQTFIYMRYENLTTGDVSEATMKNQTGQINNP